MFFNLDISSGRGISAKLECRNSDVREIDTTFLFLEIDVTNF